MAKKSKKRGKNRETAPQLSSVAKKSVEEELQNSGPVATAVSGSEGKKQVSDPGDNENIGKIVPRDRGFLDSIEIGMTLTFLPESPALGGQALCLLRHEAKERLLATHGFPSPPTPPACPDSYRIAQSPGRGLGMFATRPFRTGDLIAVERPMIIRPVFWYSPQRYAEFSTRAELLRALAHDEEMCLQEMFARMPPEHQDAYRKLWASPTGLPGLPKLCYTFGANFHHLHGLGCDIPGPGHRADGYVGLFNDLSRMNHSCRPNVINNFINKSLTLEVRAARDIAEDEEIMLPYADLFLPTAIRLTPRTMKSCFTCSCEACRNPTLSDTLRLELKKDHDRWNRKTVCLWATDLELSDDELLKPLLHRISLFRQEGLESTMPYWRSLACAAGCYSALGDADKMTSFSTTALLLFHASSSTCGEDDHALAYCFADLWEVRKRMIERRKVWTGLFGKTLQQERARHRT